MLLACKGLSKVTPSNLHTLTHTHTHAHTHSHTLPSLQRFAFTLQGLVKHTAKVFIHKHHNRTHANVHTLTHTSFAAALCLHAARPGEAYGASGRQCPVWHAPAAHGGPPVACSGVYQAGRCVENWLDFVHRITWLVGFCSAYVCACVPAWNREAWLC